MLQKHGSEQVPAPRVCYKAFFGVSNHTGIRQCWRNGHFKMCILSITSLHWSGNSREQVKTELAELLAWVSSKTVSFYLFPAQHFIFIWIRMFSNFLGLWQYLVVCWNFLSQYFQCWMVSKFLFCEEFWHFYFMVRYILKCWHFLWNQNSVPTWLWWARFLTLE